MNALREAEGISVRLKLRKDVPKNNVKRNRGRSRVEQGQQARGFQMSAESPQDCDQKEDEDGGMKTPALGVLRTAGPTYWSAVKGYLLSQA